MKEEGKSHQPPNCGLGTAPLFALVGPAMRLMGPLLVLYGSRRCRQGAQSSEWAGDEKGKEGSLCFPRHLGICLLPEGAGKASSGPSWPFAVGLWFILPPVRFSTCLIGSSCYVL